MTQAGMILGTAAYMSPEQAKGRVVDKRADIWAFGVVLFEMLTGQRAFKGDDVSETLASVLKDTPHFAALPPSTPSRVRALIERCVERDVKLRLRDIGEARIEIARIEAGAPDGATTPATAAVVAPVWRRALPWAVATALAVALAASLSVAVGRTQTGAPLRRFTLALPSKSAPNWNDFRVAISPDGAQLAYNCREGNTVSLCLRALDSLTAHRVADGRDASDWFFSPDGEWIGIVDDVGLSKVSVRGGQPQTIYRWPGTAPAPTGFSWGPDDYILFGTASGIQRVAASGGSPEAVTRIGPGADVAAHTFPSHMPDGRERTHHDRSSRRRRDRRSRRLEGRLDPRPRRSGATASSMCPRAGSPSSKVRPCSPSRSIPLIRCVPQTRCPSSRTSTACRAWHATARSSTFRRAVNPARGSYGSIARGVRPPSRANASTTRT